MVEDKGNNLSGSNSTPSPASTPNPKFTSIESYSTTRFPTNLSLTTTTTFKVAKDSHLSAIATLGPFTSNSEEEAESFIDRAAALITRYQIPITTFIPALITNQTGPHITTFEQISNNGYTDYEDFFNLIIKNYFPFSNYHMQLVQDIVLPKRFETVRESVSNHKQKLTNYARCRGRWNLPHLLTDAIIPISLKLSLPIDIEEHLNIQNVQNETVDSISKTAAIVEAARIRTRTITALAQPTHYDYGGPHRQIYRTNPPIEGGPYQGIHALPAAPQSYSGPPRSNCNGCGGDHWRKNCPHRESRCYNCEEIGHISTVCRTSVDRDRSGRLTSKVKSTNKGNFISTRKDSSRLDEAITGLNVLDNIKDRAIKANDTRRLRSQIKNPNPSPRKDHPVLAAQPYNLEEGEYAYQDDFSQN